jgi:hypothetical protein
MIRFLPPAFVAVLLTSAMQLPKTSDKIRRASSTFTCCRYHGHHRSAPPRPSAAGVEQQMHSAVFGLIRS